MTRIGLACLVLAVAAYARPDVSWLVRSDARAGRVFLQPSLSARPYPGEVAIQSEQTQPAGFGVYALEFGGAAVGTGVSAACAYAAASHVSWGEQDAMQLLTSFVAGSVTYAVTSMLLSAVGTHLVGKLMGHRRSFAHALVGGAVGGVLGTVALVDYAASSNLHADDAMLPVGLVLPPLAAVIAYNVWRR
jgi:hypothetical protein